MTGCAKIWLNAKKKVNYENVCSKFIGLLNVLTVSCTWMSTCKGKTSWLIKVVISSFERI